MLFPKKVKYRKWQKGIKSRQGVATRGNSLVFGSFGLKSEEAKWIKAEQIEAARRVISRFVQKNGKMWIRVFPDKPVTKKPSEVTMGGGKGDPVGYVFPAKPGSVLFEIDGLPENSAREALRRAGTKLPVKTKVVSRQAS